MEAGSGGKHGRGLVWDSKQSRGQRTRQGEPREGRWRSVEEGGRVDAVVGVAEVIEEADGKGEARAGARYAEVEVAYGLRGAREAEASTHR